VIILNYKLEKKMISRKSFNGAALAGLLCMGVSLPLYAADTASSKEYAGQTITVMLPPWGTLPKNMVDRFQLDTGIKINMQTLGWDEIRAKVITSLVAGISPADVVEVDWSWVGQFGAAGWFTPLDKIIGREILSDTPSSKIFQYKGQTLAVPYNNDFRLMIVNKAHLSKAGIIKMPKTMDQLLIDARALKASGASKYPIALPLSATEGTATAWYLLTKAYGGELFDDNFRPQFASENSPGHKALQFIQQAVKEGLIDPAATGMTDVQVQDAFKGGQYSIDLAGWPGNLSTYNDKTKSKIAGSATAALMPSSTGSSRSFGLVEGLGIPQKSKNKGAASEFIKWWMRVENQVEVYEVLSDLPTRNSALKVLIQQNKLNDGEVLLEQIKGVTPLFASGSPEWYPELSREASAAINQMAKGQLTVNEVAKQIADKTEKAMKK